MKKMKRNEKEGKKKKSGKAPSTVGSIALAGAIYRQPQRAYFFPAESLGGLRLPMEVVSRRSNVEAYCEML